MKKRILSLFLASVLLLTVLCGCGEKAETSGELTFREVEAVRPLPPDVRGEELSEPEIAGITAGVADTVFSHTYGMLYRNADGTLHCVILETETESQNGTYTVLAEEVALYPNELPDFQETCTVSGVPVDARRWETGDVTCCSASFLRADEGRTPLGVRLTVYNNDSEGDKLNDNLSRLSEMVAFYLNPENALTLDGVYSGPDFLRRTETAQTPISPETEAELREAARAAMGAYCAGTAQDSVIPAESTCSCMTIRAVGPDGDQMLLDADMTYKPASWDWSDVDDGYKFPEGVPGWYSGQTTLQRGEGDSLAGTQGFLLLRGADGRWQVAPEGPGGPIRDWLRTDVPNYGDFVTVRWTV